MNANDINLAINRFLDGYSRWLLVAMILAAAGILMKMWAIAGGGVVFVLSVFVLALLFLVQTGLSFFYIVTNFWLALLGAFCSVGLVLGFMAIIFRYQEWPGWQLMLFVTLPMYFISAMMLVYFLLKKRTLPSAQFRFLVRNLIVPFVFTMLLLLVSFILSPGVFYQTFNPLDAEEKQQLERPSEENEQENEEAEPAEQYEI